jgi:hypothetical protein
VSSLSLITYFSLHCCPHSTIIGWWIIHSQFIWILFPSLH